MQQLLPQLKAVEAFRRSLKKNKSSKKEDGTISKELQALLPPSYQSSSSNKNEKEEEDKSCSPESDSASEKKNKKCDDDLDFVDEVKKETINPTSVGGVFLIKHISAISYN